MVVSSEPGLKAEARVLLARGQGAKFNLRFDLEETNEFLCSSTDQDFTATAGLFRISAFGFLFGFRLSDLRI